MPLIDTMQPDALIPIGSRVRVNRRIESSWNGQTGTIIGYRGEPDRPDFRYWVNMTVLHPVLKQPLTVDGEKLELPQMFRPDELTPEPATTPDLS